MKIIKALYGMPFALAAALVLLLGCALTDAGEATVSYYGRLQVHPNFLNHPESEDPLWNVQGSEVMLSNAGAKFRVSAQTDGSFVFHNLPYGTYHMHCEYAHFIYPTVRVDITEKTTQGGSMPVIRTYTNDGTMSPVEGNGLDADTPVIIPLVSMHLYYIPREQYSIMDILKNPMILMMLVSMGMLGMMQMVPEEERKESAKELQNLRKQWSGKPVQDAKQPHSPTAQERKAK